jgi:hypothetical protein
VPESRAGVFWRRELSPFLDPAPEFAGSEERIFVPSRDLTITLFFEGGIARKGTATTIQINLNYSSLIVLHQERAGISTVSRFEWSRFLGFELAWRQRTETHRSKPHLFLVPGTGKRR